MKEQKGFSMVIGACDFLSASLAITFGAKHAYAPTIDKKDCRRPLLSSILGRARYRKVTFVEDSVRDYWKNDVYANACQYLGYPFGEANPADIHIPRSKKIVDDNMLDDLIESLSDLNTDVVVLPYFSVFAKGWHPIQEQIDSAIAAVARMNESGLNVIYTTPFFADANFIKDGMWARNSFFRVADVSLFVEPGDFRSDQVLVHHLLKNGHDVIEGMTYVWPIISTSEDVNGYAPNEILP